MLTPIFHALTRGGWRGRSVAFPAVGAPDPMEAFRRDPLGAPIPVQALAQEPAARRPSSRGRHHHRFSPAGGAPRW